MSLTTELFGSAVPPSASSSSAEKGTGISFEPTKKAAFDLFALAPQVKKATRKEKQQLLLNKAKQASGQAAATVSSSSAKRRFKRKKGLVGEEVDGVQSVSDTNDIFKTVLITDEAEAGVGDNNTGRRSQKKKGGHKSVLRHGLQKNEEEDARTVFVGNLVNDAKRRDVERVFKSCGEIESVRVRAQALEVEKDNRSVGRAIRVLRGDVKRDDKFSAVAFVLFKEATSVAEALKKNGIVLHGRHIVVTSMDAEGKAYAPETSIFIGNIAYDTNEETVWNFFTEKGVADVRRVRLVRDRDTGHCKGFGYVEFHSPSSVAKAIAVRGSLLNEREIRIVHVQKSKEVTQSKASRREKRGRQESNTRVPNEGRKKSKWEDNTRRNNHHNKQNNSNYKNSRRDSDKGEDHPSWMGVVTNPRRKMPKDLRPLVEGKSGGHPAGPRIPVKRKMRNPEK